MDPIVREARPDDDAAIAAIAQRTWPDRETDDYLPRVFGDWLADPDRRTLVVDADGAVAVCSGHLLTDDEAWLSGIRVHPDHRGEGYGTRLVEALFEWAREEGATVGRNLVFSWNDAGLGQSVGAGFEPVTSVRWGTPEPRETAPDVPVTDDPAAAWRYWTHSEARTALSGLALAPGESWSLAELTERRLRRAGEQERVFAVHGDGTSGMAYRDRIREHRDGNGTVAEYGVAAWDDPAAGRALLAAVRTDAARAGADATRILLPETPRHVAEAAHARADLEDWPSFVLAADLTGEALPTRR